MRNSVLETSIEFPGSVIVAINVNYTLFTKMDYHNSTNANLSVMIESIEGAYEPIAGLSKFMLSNNQIMKSLCDLVLKHAEVEEAEEKIKTG